MNKDFQKPQSEAAAPSSTPQELSDKRIVSPAVGEDTTATEGPVKISGPRQADHGGDPTSRFGELTHSYLQGHIRLADQKAAFLFAAGTALLAFLYKDQAPATWSRFFSSWSFGDFIVLIAMIGLAGAVMISFTVVVPSLKGSRRGYIFFEGIALFESSRKYSESVLKLSSTELSQETLEHCYELSKICRRKYRLLSASIYSGAVGLAATLIYLLFS